VDARDEHERRHALVGPARLWKMKRDFQIDFLKRMRLEPEHFLLDLGCGTLRGGLPLIEYLEDGHYFGVEVRPEVLEEGRKELREAGLEHKRPTLLVADRMSDLVIDHQFDFVWAFSVLIHMNDEALSDTLSMVRNHLRPGGAFFANVNLGEEATKGKWQGFPVVSHPLAYYAELCDKNGLEALDIGPLQEYGHLSGVEAQDQQRMLKIVKGRKSSR